MPQTPVNSSNIATFSFSASVDLYQRQIVFDASGTTYNGSGIANVLGIAFSLEDSVGLELMGVDWTAPQIMPNVSQTYTLDLTSLPINFFFQGYKIIGYIKDADGTVYQTSPVLKTICQPNGINESGYVNGDFAVTADCLNNVLTVKEFTPLVYDNKTPLSVSKAGVLSYPTGTISPISFTGTPIVNNVVYTGEYRIVCTTIATYDLSDDIFVLVTYITSQPFDIVCSNFIGDITCCLADALATYRRNCENAIGQAALQKYNSILPVFTLGLAKQVNGQDASAEVAEIRKTLNCNCGGSSLRQNEGSPTNPAIYSIVLNGVGGTSIPSATITGNTKTFNIASKAYVVSKGDTGDLAYTITTDTSVTNVVTYKITFNYDNQALYNLNAIAANPTLLNLLNSLVTGSGGSIAGLDGKCVIDLTTANYAVSQAVNSGTLITNIVINGTNYAAPGSLFANNATAVASWLNSLSLGVFTAVVNSGTLTIQSVNNTNVISTITFTTPNIVKQFAATNATLVQVLQAVIDYLCNLTALQVALGNQLNLCTFDYNGDIVTTNYGSSVPQSTFNAGVASAICNIATRIDTLTGLTCDKLKAIFIDRLSTEFIPATDRIYGTLGGDCAGITDQQVAKLVIAAINNYTDVKALYCAIDCTTPGSCPDISNTSLAMSGANIGIYGLTWATSTLAAQTVTVRYRITGSLVWITATNALLIAPNGNISGSTPYLITGVAVGTTYDVNITNNCGGAGFTKQITTPTGSVYSGDYLLDNIIYDICGASPVTLYSSAPFGSGIIMYSDIGLTTPVTGYTFITNNTGSNIFQLNTSTGVVGIDTGSSCTTGMPGTYVLDNSTGTICSGSPVTLYTNGAFAVGKVLYIDVALTTPQTGYSYVLNLASNHTYNLNSGTGAVGADTGILCTGTATLTFSFVNAGTLIFGASLNNPIDAALSIDRVFADGFTDGACSTSAVSSAQKNTSMIIGAGGTGVGGSPTATTGTWATAAHYSIYNVIINGAAHVNGDVVPYGTFNVTIIIPACN